jgi:hypothetical protein
LVTEVLGRIPAAAITQLVLGTDFVAGNLTSGFINLDSFPTTDDLTKATQYLFRYGSGGKILLSTVLSSLITRAPARFIVSPQ